MGSQTLIICAISVYRKVNDVNIKLTRNLFVIIFSFSIINSSVSVLVASEESVLANKIVMKLERKLIVLGYHFVIIYTGQNSKSIL